MRLFWIIWVGPKSNDMYTYETPREKTEKRESHVKIEVEMKVMQPQPRNTWMKKQGKILP